VTLAKEPEYESFGATTFETHVRRTMSFSHECLDTLPALAWLFLWSSDGQGQLLHGTAVQVEPEQFFEGCFAGEWGENLTEVGNVFGSGMRMHGSGWTVITPSHTLEAVFLYRHQGGWGVSNSLALLLEYHRIELPWDPLYGAKFASACLGIGAYEKLIFRTLDGEVFRVLYDNVELTLDGNYRFLQKPSPPPFACYEDYVGYLTETLRKAFATAAQKGRAFIYAPLATCSTGYDSAAGAAIARRLGCGEAVTVRTARGGEVDSGRPVGEALGLQVHEVARTDAVEGSFAQVAEFLGSGMGGEDYCYLGFAPLLAGRILLTGFHGDKIWEMRVGPNAVLSRGDISGSSLQEFRLRRNFLHIPIPLIAATRHADIAAISRSPEMAPYQLLNDYDRPIPRRLLEESGVARALFGQHKKAASTLLFQNPHLLGPIAQGECESLVPAEWLRSAESQLRKGIWMVRVSGFQAFNRIGGASADWIKRVFIPDWRVFEHSHARSALHFCAAIAYLRLDYNRSLKGRAAHSIS
jgi:hypothetical protein